MALFRFAFLVCMAYVILYPVLILLSRAFRPMEDMYNPAIVWLPITFTLENFTMVMQRLEFWDTLLTTLQVVFFSTVLTVASCAVTGYGLARYRLRLGKIYMLLVVLSIIVPFVVILVPYIEATRNIHFLWLGETLGFMYSGVSRGLTLFGTPWVYYMPAMLGAGLRSGLFILLFYQFFRSMPKELESAARIDGCGEMKTFLRVMLPNAGAPMLVTAILSFVWYWSDFYIGQFLFTEPIMMSNRLAMVRASIYTAGLGGDRPGGEGISVLIFAAALLFIIPPLLLYIVAQRFFMRSVERTGIVG